MEEYSVLMSVYEKENPVFFRNSIESMMKQRLPFSDFVLVCDGPLGRELEEVIQWAEKCLKDRFQCVRLPENRGLGKALAEGITHCKYDIVARMDSDDLSRPERCRLQMEAMETGGYDIVGCALEEFREIPGDTGNIRLSPEHQEEIRVYAGKRNPFNHPCVMYRKSAVLKAGNYVDFPGFEDYCLWIRMLQKGAKAYNLQQVLLDMRSGEGMYDRRGGISYIKSVLRFQKYLKCEGIIGTGTFLKNCAVRTIVGIIPGNLRKEFYRIFLRKKQ